MAPIAAGGPQTVSAQQLQALMQEATGLWLVDVRNPAAFEAGHIEGAVNIPDDALATKRLPKGKSVVLVDDSLGLRRARQAAERLAATDMENLFILDGGMVAWEIAGYPLAGTGYYRKLRMVTPEELTWARARRIPLQILDLREQKERNLVSFPDAVELPGATMPERIMRLKERLKGEAQASPVGQAGRANTTIVILPLTADAVAILERAARELPGDLRYFEGGQAAWMANPDKRLKLGDSCPTCPGETREGIRR